MLGSIHWIEGQLSFLCSPRLALPAREKRRIGFDVARRHKRRMFEGLGLARDLGRPGEVPSLGLPFDTLVAFLESSSNEGQRGFNQQLTKEK